MTAKFTHYGGQIRYLYIYKYSNYTTSHECGTHPYERNVTCNDYFGVMLPIPSNIYRVEIPIA